MRLIAALLSLLSFVGCKPNASVPKQAGVSTALVYPVLLIGQSSLNVRDSEDALVSIPGASSLNLVERLLLDSEGRLFKVTRATVVEGYGNQRAAVFCRGCRAAPPFVAADSGAGARASTLPLQRLGWRRARGGPRACAARRWRIDRSQPRIVELGALNASSSDRKKFVGATLCGRPSARADT